MRIDHHPKSRIEIELQNESELIICPNSKCRKKIEKPILLSDLSTPSAEKYYACPHCFVKLDLISTRPQKEKEEKKKEEPPVKSLEEEELLVKPSEEEKGPSRCAGYLGYLSSRPENAPIPKECLTCPKVLDCVMKISDS